MRYLARALAQGPAAARPAMRTGSPLAEADQRLHFDAFAARFDAPMARGAATEELAPDPFEAEALDATQEASIPSPAHRGPRRAEALAPARRLLSPSPTSASSPPPAPTSGAVVPSPVVASQPRPDAAPSASRSATSPVSPVLPRALAPRASVPSTLAPNPERSHPRDAIVHEPDREPAPSSEIDASRPRPIAPMIPPNPLTPEPRVPDVISQALAKVATWLDRPSPVEPAQAVGEASPAREREVSAPVARREPLRASIEPPAPSRPRLEIGSIEVEVVPPERPRRAAAPARTSGRAVGSMGPIFGWRQR